MIEQNTKQFGARATTGFTLLEILTVIGVIAILSGMVLGVGRRAGESAKISRTKAELAALAGALEAYRRIYGDYPQVVSDALDSDSASVRSLYAALNGRRGPLVFSANFPVPQRVLLDRSQFTLADPAAAESAENGLIDPWGNSYHYAYHTAAAGWRNSSFVLLSAGPDGNATMPVPSDGLIGPAYESVRQDGRPVNADNVYANRD